jgi:hypothetical protein
MTGWDNPDTAQFRRDVRSMEQSPFDGTILYALGRGSDGKLFDLKTAFSTNHWDSDCFSVALADLKAAHSHKLADIDGQGGPRVNRLEQDIASALNAADEYVWVYGEKARWWPPRQADVKASPTWPEVLPGIDFALLNAKDPSEAALLRLKQIRSQGTFTNLLLNGVFATVKNGQPESWSHWQDEKESHGSFSHDSAVGATAAGSACLAGVEHGCFVQSVKVVPGQHYIIAGRTRWVGGGSAWLTVRWQTAEGKWVAEDRDRHFPAAAANDTSAWVEITGSVIVPEDAGRLVVLAGASGQQNGNDRVWFDDLLVVPLR